MDPGIHLTHEILILSLDSANALRRYHLGADPVNPNERGLSIIQLSEEQIRFGTLPEHCSVSLAIRIVHETVDRWQETPTTSETLRLRLHTQPSPTITSEPAPRRPDTNSTAKTNHPRKPKTSRRHTTTKAMITLTLKQRRLKNPSRRCQEGLPPRFRLATGAFRHRLRDAVPPGLKSHFYLITAQCYHTRKLDRRRLPLHANGAFHDT